MVIVIKKSLINIVKNIRTIYKNIFIIFFIASKCVKIIFKPFIGTCIPFQTSVTGM